LFVLVHEAEFLIASEVLVLRGGLVFWVVRSRKWFLAALVLFWCAWFGVVHRGIEIPLPVLWKCASARVGRFALLGAASSSLEYVHDLCKYECIGGEYVGKL